MASPAGSPHSSQELRHEFARVRQALHASNALISIQAGQIETELRKAASHSWDLERRARSQTPEPGRIHAAGLDKGLTDLLASLKKKDERIHECEELFAREDSFIHKLLLIPNGSAVSRSTKDRIEEIFSFASSRITGTAELAKKVSLLSHKLCGLNHKVALLLRHRSQVRSPAHGRQTEHQLQIQVSELKQIVARMTANKAIANMELGALRRKTDRLQTSLALKAKKRRVPEEIRATVLALSGRMHAEAEEKLVRIDRMKEKLEYLAGLIVEKKNILPAKAKVCKAAADLRTRTGGEVLMHVQQASTRLDSILSSLGEQVEHAKLLVRRNEETKDRVKVALAIVRRMWSSKAERTQKLALEKDGEIVWLRKGLEAYQMRLDLTQKTLARETRDWTAQLVKESARRELRLAEIQSKNAEIAALRSRCKFYCGRADSEHKQICRIRELLISAAKSTIERVMADTFGSRILPAVQKADNKLSRLLDLVTKRRERPDLKHTTKTMDLVSVILTATQRLETTLLARLDSLSSRLQTATAAIKLLTGRGPAEQPDEKTRRLQTALMTASRDLDQLGVKYAILSKENQRLSDELHVVRVQAERGSLVAGEASETLRKILVFHGVPAPSATGPEQLVAASRELLTIMQETERKMIAEGSPSAIGPSKRTEARGDAAPGGESSPKPGLADRYGSEYRRSLVRIASLERQAAESTRALSAVQRQLAEKEAAVSLRYVTRWGIDEGTVGGVREQD